MVPQLFMRIKFKKGKQREFFNEVLQNLACPSLRELINRGINVNYSTLKNYFSEARLMPESLYKELCHLSKIDEKRFEVEFVGNFWGQVKGGKKSLK